jgi:hypothetical protein
MISPTTVISGDTVISAGHGGGVLKVGWKQY